MEEAVFTTACFRPTWLYWNTKLKIFRTGFARTRPMSPERIARGSVNMSSNPICNPISNFAHFFSCFRCSQTVSEDVLQSETNLLSINKRTKPSGFANYLGPTYPHVIRQPVVIPMSTPIAMTTGSQLTYFRFRVGACQPARRRFARREKWWV